MQIEVGVFLLGGTPPFFFSTFFLLISWPPTDSTGAIRDQ
jgi:hypothetical protein